MGSPMTRRQREVVAAFDGVAATYGPGGSNLSATLLRDRARRRLLARVPPGGLVIDAACGTGVDTAAFAAAGRRVAAFDVAPAMVRVARVRLAPWIRRGLVTVRRMEFRTAAAGPARADGVWCHWGTNFEPTLTPFAAFCRRVLRPGGVAVFTTAMRWPLWEMAAGLARGRAHEAVRRLQPGGVRLRFGGRAVTAYAPPLGRALAPFRAGFFVERIEPLGLLLPPPALWRPGWKTLAPLWRVLAALEPGLRPFVRLADHALVIVSRR
jgi:SAM-dependent methyltransferase